MFPLLRGSFVVFFGAAFFFVLAGRISSGGHHRPHYIFSDGFRVSSNSVSFSGRLNITTTDESTKWRGYNPYKRKYETLEKYYRSSMLNTWNKFCFKGEAQNEKSGVCNYTYTHTAPVDETGNAGEMDTSI